MVDSECTVSYASLHLPKSCLHLASLHITVPIDMSMENIQSSERVISATGYMLEYTASKFKVWLDKFCQQSNTRYSVHTGKQTNKKQQHGTIQVQEDCFSFKIEGSQTYSCFRAGQG